MGMQMDTNMQPISGLTHGVPEFRSASMSCSSCNCSCSWPCRHTPVRRVLAAKNGSPPQVQLADGRSCCGTERRCGRRSRALRRGRLLGDAMDVSCPQQQPAPSWAMHDQQWAHWSQCTCCSTGLMRRHCESDGPSTAQNSHFLGYALKLVPSGSSSTPDGAVGCAQCTLPVPHNQGMPACQLPLSYDRCSGTRLVELTEFSFSYDVLAAQVAPSKSEQGVGTCNLLKAPAAPSQQNILYLNGTRVGQQLLLSINGSTKLCAQPGGHGGLSDLDSWSTTLLDR